MLVLQVIIQLQVEQAQQLLLQPLLQFMQAVVELVEQEHLLLPLARVILVVLEDQAVVEQEAQEHPVLMEQQELLILVVAAVQQVLDHVVPFKETVVQVAQV
jgi:hypothetical protein